MEAFDPFFRFVAQAAKSAQADFQAAVCNAWPFAYKPATPREVLGEAFLTNTVKKWHDGAVATAAGCMLRLFRTGWRARQDIFYAVRVRLG